MNLDKYEDRHDLYNRKVPEESDKCVFKYSTEYVKLKVLVINSHTQYKIIFKRHLDKFILKHAKNVFSFNFHFQ